ncbi:unnamed protein product (mitochondrion) [Plasmodiophora brassicae]|uniref:DEAD/DEAH box helicase n=1 Tax=Plasmodiophora brassicae TaxID=37360 RepID=A0A3P3YLB0_PLABS|nr:unnamed protein product [Plasmodiophora brassicae]
MTAVAVQTCDRTPLAAALDAFRHGERLHIIGDPADADRPFAVDFDSLVLKAIQASRPAATIPLVPLAVCAAYERQLADLSVSGRLLHIIALRDAKQYWKESSVMAVLRIALLEHTRVLASNPDLRLDLFVIAAKDLPGLVTRTLPAYYMVANPRPLMDRMCPEFRPVPGAYQLDMVLLHVSFIMHFKARIPVVHLEDVLNDGPATYGTTAYGAADDDAVASLGVIAAETESAVFGNDGDDAVATTDAPLPIDQVWDLSVLRDDEKQLWACHDQLRRVMPIADRASIRFGADADWSPVADVIRSFARSFVNQLGSSRCAHGDLIDAWDPNILALACDATRRADLCNTYKVHGADRFLSSLPWKFHSESTPAAAPTQAPLLAKDVSSSSLVTSLTSAKVSWSAVAKAVISDPTAPANTDTASYLSAGCGLDLVVSEAVASAAKASSDAAEDKWKRKQAQLYATFLDKYSANLTDGLTRRRDVVLAAPTPPSAKESKKGGGGGGKKGKGGRSGKIDVRQAASAAILSKQTAAADDKVKGFMAQAERSTCDEGIAFIESKLTSIDDMGLQFPTVAAKAYLFLCGKWAEAFRNAKRDRVGPTAENAAALGLFCAVRDVERMYGSVLTAEQLGILVKYLCDIGLSSLGVKLCHKYKLPASSSSAQRESSFGSAERFQLNLAGYRMVRDVQSKVDPRVSFIPDRWQVDMIDAVDARSSLLVVAPTSSGKTFVSYYCMEKVLSNNRASAGRSLERVVFVMPTRALVNQTVADIYKRYGQRFAVLTEVQDDVTSYTAEILITVPQCLQQRLLSNAQADMAWVQSLRYAIFDEVHMIVDCTTGSVWERAIALVPCPVICLSATVGNVSALHQWLQKVQDRKSMPLQFVQYSERWNDHHYQVYVPADAPRTAPGQSFKPDDPQWTLGSSIGARNAVSCPDRLVDLHPVGLWATQTARTVIERHGSLSGQTKLSPSEALTLYDTLYELTPTSERKAFAHEFSPETYFRGEFFISQGSARRWAQLLVDVANRPQYATKVADKLLSPVVSGLSVVDRVIRSDSFDFAAANFFDAILELDRTDKLPVIAFCLDRQRCSDLVIATIQRLIELTPAPKQRFTEAERAKAKKDLIKMKEKLDKKKSKEGDEQLQEQIGALESALFTEAPVDRRYVFGGVVRSSQDAEYWLNRIRRRHDWSSDPTKQLLMKGLELGIGVHHGGMDKRYRDAVEALFRMGHVRVCVATTTLSVGINMPCRTVMLVGDNQLNPLIFRQMIGRAGRRGYDYVGNVLFLGISPNRIASLACHQLTAVYKNVSVNSTVTASLAGLVASAQYEKDVRLAAQRTAILLDCPLGGAVDVVQQVFLKSIAFLVRHRLLRPDDGKLRWTRWSALQAALTAEREPGNVALCDLICSGVLSGIADAAGSAEKAATALLPVLAHLFHRRNLSEFCAPGIKEMTLDQLPDAVSLVLKQLEVDAIAGAVQFFQRLPGKPACLPFSRMTWPGPAPESVRCPFNALSGADPGAFASAGDFHRNIAPALVDYIKTIPLLSDLDRPASNYAVAFFKNDTTYTNLLKATGMSDQTMWNSLREWNTTLQCIASVVSVPGDKSLLARGLAVLSAQFNDLFTNIGSL